MRRVLIASLFMALLAPAAAQAQFADGERYTGSITNARASADGAGNVLLSADNLTVDVDPCHDGFYDHYAIISGSFFVEGCGAAAYVVDERYQGGHCPVLSEQDAYEYIKPLWFVDIAPEDRVLNSGAGAVEPPPNPPGESAARAYRLCVYATEDISGTQILGVTGFHHYLVAEQVVDAPPSPECLELLDEVERASADRAKARRKLDSATKLIEKLKADKDRSLKDRRKLKKAKARSRKAQAAVEDANRFLKNARIDVQLIC